jgi:catechol 2,3-dioxygenase-like lactoylglutathione lyase family enzyme
MKINGIDHVNIRTPDVPSTAKFFGDVLGMEIFDAPATSGRIHHVALRCTGFDETEARLRAKGIDYRANNRQFGDLRQIFVIDPNGIQLELNFAAD